MKTVFHTLAIVTAIAALVGQSTGGGPKNRLEGDWDVVSMSRDGKTAPAEIVDEAFIRLTPSALVPVHKKTMKEQTGAKVDYKIAGTKEIDLTTIVSVKSKGGKDAELKITKYGIFELNGDTLRLSWTETGATQIDDAGKITPLPPGTRPANFDGGPGVFATVLKRRPAR